ncbi:UDP-glucose 4-epimerase GalE [Candidatus Nitrosacidococcus sp. I8]|uniref:UDP-glucose 4-epimerase GalE n=1 Tax=Candidatus Nitrosacidococcus sp. I8 TaxID=2942908 RepID=UPI002227A87C|nr:UDP-glucose 4-epimerase GalE [Candidatus Nitrosacidococcus sp. I8]CAH9017223.1 UDP-glucose 4-epimerase [Candidatus Nitrosacidococcus sp. I8]
MEKGILVTGGAGYIGSHVVLQLVETYSTVVILDNLSTGFADAVIGAKLIIGNVKNQYLVKNILKEYSIDTVLHFAAHTIVPESVSNPLKYYANNTCATRNLLECCVEEGVKNFVFSSTAAAYGIPSTPTVTEDTPTNPINPYGSSKLMSEWMLQDLSQAAHLNYVILRYFNVAGSDPRGRIGQSTRNATLLIKAACEVAVGKRESIHIFGVDYSTPDGTGIRDYIHVEDLAKAHLLALDYLRSGGQSILLNCGYGHGYSVREVLDSVQRVCGKPIKIIESPRRLGDPPQLIAIADKIRDTLGWIPQCDNLDFIVKTSLDWEQKLLLKDH